MLYKAQFVRLLTICYYCNVILTPFYCSCILILTVLIVIWTVSINLVIGCSPSIFIKHYNDDDDDDDDDDR